MSNNIKNHLSQRPRDFQEDCKKPDQDLIHFLLCSVTILKLETGNLSIFGGIINRLLGRITGCNYGAMVF